MSEVKGDWGRIHHLFHKLWGQAKDQVYEKHQWQELQKELEKARPSEVQDPLANLYVVRLFDMFDGWIDVSEPLPKAEAELILKEKTQNGTKNTKYGDGDYYSIFPANTRMLITPETTGR